MERRVWQAALIVCLFANPIASNADQTRFSDALIQFFGFGEGLARGVVLSQKPARTERRVVHGHSVDLRFYSGNGMRVVAYASSQDGKVGVLEVALLSRESIAAAGPSIHLLTRPSVESALGEPFSRTPSSVRYRGLAEICNDFLDFGFSDQELTSMTWTFCVD